MFAMAVGRHALTRDAVVAAARDLLVEAGLEAVSLRRVASRLGVTAPALYAYVDDKEDLLRGIAEVEFSELITRFDAVDQTDPLERIAALGRTYIAYARERPERFRLIFRHAPELATGAPTGAELPLATKAFEVAAQATEDAMAAGAIRRRRPAPHQPHAVDSGSRFGRGAAARVRTG